MSYALVAPASWTCARPMSTCEESADIRAWKLRWPQGLTSSDEAEALMDGEDFGVMMVKQGLAHAGRRLSTTGDVCPRHTISDRARR